MITGAKSSTICLELLSKLLLGFEESRDCAEIAQTVSGFGASDFAELLDLAASHHVIMRTFPNLSRALASAAGTSQRGDANREWVENAISSEQRRIEHALTYVSPIEQALEEAGDVLVIKSLDHWPDLGNDIDLYTNAQSADVVALMEKRFRARPAERSWGDRLANKWNFIVPDLPELVEVHVGRLGQTGEQVAITNSLIARAHTRQFGSHALRVPAAEDRLIISTLQRMYRHFYLRLCDIVDNALLVDSGIIDYNYLYSLASSAGLWDGLANYLVMISEYVEPYRGAGLSLPSLVTRAARPDIEPLRLKRKFLRVPLFPHAASFYTAEWTKLLFNREWQNTMRLSLLPGLAIAAAVEMKFSGNDKGIW